MDFLEYGQPWALWEIVKLIGLGGFSAVYEACRKTKIKTARAAIKIIQSPYSEDSELREYSNQLDLITSESNPNIVRIEDHLIRSVSSLPGEPTKSLVYIREELLEEIKRYFHNCAFDEKVIVKMGIDICSALESLEHLEIIHGRVIPNNIFVVEGTGGEPLFKLACDTVVMQQRNSMSPPRNEEAVFYTRYYSAPEIINNKITDKTADIYSLGITLYKYLNHGLFPFMRAETSATYSNYEYAEEIRLKNTQKMPAPAGTSDELSAIILKAVSYNPSDRFQSAAEFKNALSSYLYPAMQAESFPELPWRNWYITRRIGSGGFSTVYEAEQKTNTSRIRHSAVKIVEIPGNDENLEKIRYAAGLLMIPTSRYLDQSYEAAKEEINAYETFINHPNIVHLEDSECISHYDPSEEITRYTIFMRLELLKRIQDHFSNNRMDENTVLKMGIHISSALEQIESYRTADGKRVFHRDVTPENILVSVSINGQTYFKLNDFGIVRKVRESFETSMTDVGKPFFIAPEIKNKRRANPTIDVYSLGIVMYFYLNDNCMPFMDTSDSVSEAEEKRLSGKETIPAPKQASKQLGEIVLKAIAYNPEDRFKNASEMKKALLTYRYSLPDFMEQLLDY